MYVDICLSCYVCLGLIYSDVWNSPELKLASQQTDHKNEGQSSRVQPYIWVGTWKGYLHVYMHNRNNRDWVGNLRPLFINWLLLSRMHYYLFLIYVLKHVFHSLLGQCHNLFDMSDGCTFTSLFCSLAFLNERSLL